MRYDDDDDIDVGNVEIGDSTRGMQRDDFVGAATALKQLRGSLSQLAGSRFNAHQPINRRLRSQYRDSGQIGINISQTFTPQTDPALWQNVPLSGQSVVYTSFKPNRVVVNELLMVSYLNGSTPGTVVASVPDGSDLLLSGAFSGSINVFPNAPNAATAINCAALQAQAFGVGISWPTVNPGIPVSINLLLLNSALFRATLPSGVSVTDITSITVNVYFSMFGPQLR